MVLKLVMLVVLKGTEKVVLISNVKPVLRVVGCVVLRTCVRNVLKDGLSMNWLMVRCIVLSGVTRSTTNLGMRRILTNHLCIKRCVKMRRIARTGTTLLSLVGTLKLMILCISLYQKDTSSTRRIISLTLMKSTLVISSSITRMFC